MKNRLIAILFVLAVMDSIILPECTAQSILEGFSLRQEAQKSEDYQLAYLAVLYAASVYKGPMKHNVLPIRGIIEYLNGKLTEEYSVHSLYDGKAQIEYIYHFGEIAVLSIVSEAMDGYFVSPNQLDDAASPSEKDSAAPTGNETASDPFLFFAEATIESCNLVISCPYEGDIFPDAEVVILEKANEVPIINSDDYPRVIVVTNIDELQEALSHSGDE